MQICNYVETESVGATPFKLYEADKENSLSLIKVRIDQLLFFGPENTSTGNAFFRCCLEDYYVMLLSDPLGLLALQFERGKNSENPSCLNARVMML